MPASRQPDPVELIAGPELPSRLYRCQRCRIADTHPDPLPTGGAICDNCAGAVHPNDVIEFAPVSVRLLAVLLDVLTVGLVIVFVLIIVAWVALLFVPRGEDNSPSQQAVFWIALVMIGLAACTSLSYLVIGNASGKTVGKGATGLAVVDIVTGRAPALGGALTRTEAQFLTVLTLGLGYAMAIRDPRRQTLHDRIANTIVIET